MLHDASLIQRGERRRRRWSLVATAACSFLAGSIFVALALPALDRQFALRGHAEPTRIGQADDISPTNEPEPSPGDAKGTKPSETASTKKATAMGSIPAPTDAYDSHQVYPPMVPPLTGDATVVGPYEPDITVYRGRETGQFGIGVESNAGLVGSIIVDEGDFHGMTQGARAQKVTRYGGSPYPALSDEGRSNSMATGMSAPGSFSAGVDAGLGVGHDVKTPQEANEGKVFSFWMGYLRGSESDDGQHRRVEEGESVNLHGARKCIANDSEQKMARQRALLNSLNSVEASNIVSNDNEPILYPTPETWTPNPQMGLAGAYNEAQRRASRSDRESWSLSQVPGTEQYAPIVENLFLTPFDSPLSTFSIDVDTASYANVRRFLDGGRLPPADAVRVEEMVNYFDYDYPTPEGDEPFSVHFELADCPWRQGHRLLRVGLKGREMARGEQGPSNLVFLLDVSGSMADENKLPLVQKAMRLLVERLTEDDRVAIVTYASGTEVRLESTNGQNKEAILAAIDALRAGGSTNGSGGIQLAYQQAAKHFLAEGNNRVILATDGDLNVGITGDDELARLIAEKAKSGVFLSVLGFGTGNLQDAKLEKLADRGNGHYAYIDNLREARKVLIEELTGSLFAIAKDVKIQIEFNPARVAAYRLIGYENRVLAARDFDDDKKDAGEIGAGHTVTALYEIVPVRDPRTEWKADQRVEDEPGASLKYQKVVRPAAALSEAADSNELATVRLRYKRPDGEKSQLL
ncbi:MAG: VWA domain-containing protein, partial [Pirellulaceae bacterium]|nr:VWA domain-containing protein [Pirellulaceae bacterium]